MKIESEIIHFQNTQSQAIKLSDLQKNYLQVLKHELTIEKTFTYYLNQGWLINFEEFFQLILGLIKAKMVTNPHFFEYFKNYLLDDSSYQSHFFEKNTLCFKKDKTLSTNLSEYPFFRNLDLKLVQIFEKNSEVLTVPENCLFLRDGQTNRDLFMITSGHASVYKKINQARRKVADLFEKNIFGEAAFFWGSPRTADVVTTTPTKLIRIPFKEELYGHLIKAQIAKKLQNRLWALNALQNSDFFKHTPAESIDELIVSGKSLDLTKGSVLFNEGQSGSSFYIIVQGQIDFYQSQRKISTLNSGHTFGEIALFYSSGRRTASAICSTDVQLIEIQQIDFFKIVSKNLILAKEIEAQAKERLLKDISRQNKVA